MLWPNKNSYKEFDNGKNPCGSKISVPPPPHNSSSGPSLKHVTVTKKLINLWPTVVIGVKTNSK